VSSYGQAWQNGLVIADGGPSMTARRVSAHRLGYTRLPWSAGDPAAEEALAADVAGGIEVSRGRMHEYLRVRTAFFDRFVVTGLSAGVRQVVVGGAGYDGRSLRYAAPGVRWFEVDHPATQRDKLARLERLGAAAGDVRFVAADFTADQVGPLLLDAGLDGRLPALFLLEGVAVYLQAEVVENLLGQFRDVAASGSRLAVSMPVAGTARAGSRFHSTVASMGEPALSRFESAEAEALLARSGWSLIPAGSEDDPARWERLRSVGLLVTEAGPRPEPVPAGGAGVLGLSALLSQALVAFTIETDNEAEHRMQYRTADHGASERGSGPWLTSLVMYENCLRFLDQPRTVAELQSLARAVTNLDGMRRWGYVTISGTGVTASGRRKRPGPDAVLRATSAGQRAREVWAPLPALVEEHWRERYGADQIGALRDALVTIAGQLDPGLPDCLPILGPGLYGRLAAVPSGGQAGSASGGRENRDPLPLNALLSRPLLAFALEYESESDLSLPVSADVLRVLTAEGVQVRELPVLSGVSKEAIAMAMGVLSGTRLVATEPDPAGGRGKIARLTQKGIAAQHAYGERLARCERRWQDRLDSVAVATVRDVLTVLTAGRGRFPAAVRRARAISGRLASHGTAAGHTAVLPDGAAPRRLPGRQLIPDRIAGTGGSTTVSYGSGVQDSSMSRTRWTCSAWNMVPWSMNRVMSASCSVVYCSKFRMDHSIAGP
jgi:methyltransferase (TIGR00027 family)